MHSLSELRCYFVSLCEFENPDADEHEGDLRKISAKAFLDKVSQYAPRLLLSS